MKERKYNKSSNKSFDHKTKKFMSFTKHNRALSEVVGTVLLLGIVAR